MQSFAARRALTDPAAVDKFISLFSACAFLVTHKLSLDQVFNCDETGLNFHLLPENTLAASFEWSANGR